MTEEREVEFSKEEILMLQACCRKSLAKKPHNAETINSILQKLSGTETENTTISSDPNVQSAEPHFVPVITGDHNPKQTLIQRLLKKFKVAV